MLDQEFRICLQYWLGISLFSEGPCPRCGSLTDPFVWRALAMVIKSPDITLCVTSYLLLLVWQPCLPDSNARPADTYLPMWKAGSPAALIDITVVSPMQQLTVSQSAVTQGYAWSLQLTERQLSMGCTVVKQAFNLFLCQSKL